MSDAPDCLDPDALPSGASAFGPPDALPSEGERARRLADLAAAMGEELTLDGLTGTFQILQRRRGHRHSTDDLLTAWYAAVHAPPTGARRRLLDLGTGLGSVALALASLDPQADITAIEAQDVSFRLLTENVALNGVGERLHLVHGDLRATPLGGDFDLITGSPPYFPPGTGIVSADSQRAHARFELRGDVRDYAAAARRALAPDGQFVFCFPFPQRSRAERACEEAGLWIERSRDVVPRAGLPALFSLFSTRIGAARSEPGTLEPPFVVRDGAGAHTEEMRGARALFGLR